MRSCITKQPSRERELVKSKCTVHLVLRWVTLTINNCIMLACVVAVYQVWLVVDIKSIPHRQSITLVVTCMPLGCRCFPSRTNHQTSVVG